jgi:thermostable 8-oxoguanine DNA glycosylase
MRLKGIAGLGLAKASFAACLLYPLEADLACIDTHIQKVYLGFDRFRSLNHATYCAVEEQIRELAQRVGISTFLAQWLIWDFSRGTVSSHDIFPGGHKR